MSTTATRRGPRRRRRLSPEDVRAELLAALAGEIAEKGYRATTVGDVVGRAQMSRRAFYAHFGSKEDCYLALLDSTTTVLVSRIREAVDSSQPWQVQVRQAIGAWLETSALQPALALSWCRDAPALGEPARALQQRSQQAFGELVTDLIGRRTDHGTGDEAAVSMPPEMAIVLIGGLRELIAVQVESGRPL
ncbi:TetR/AcrR family transcriptional regulator, partial [Nocardia blacklockiae]|uniref:TetR/AcrR family transcriptional regulator n=1 Tax=Nocardia blacklockiae TaxID=480036 RepID=UPI001894F455